MNMFKTGVKIKMNQFKIIKALTLVTGFPYSVSMNVTLTLEDALVKKVRKIAVERDTTLTAMVRDFLESIANCDEELRNKKAIEALEESFKKHEFSLGPRTWSRSDLYDRT